MPRSFNVLTIRELSLILSASSWIKELNGSGGVYLAYATPKGYTLLDRRLHLPEEWFSDEYAVRRKNCGIPEEITFHKHQEWALEMLQEVRQRGKITFQWILGDEKFGQDTWLLDQIAEWERDGIYYFMQIPANTRVWLERPETETPTWKGRGRPTTGRKLVEGEPEPQQVLSQTSI